MTSNALWFVSQIHFLLHLLFLNRYLDPLLLDLSKVLLDLQKKNISRENEVTVRFYETLATNLFCLEDLVILDHRIPLEAPQFHFSLHGFDEFR